jgi:hypothetical protein
MIDSFFGIHPYVVRSGRWAKMKPGEKDLYLYLMEESERRCTREIEATDAQVASLVGSAPRTLCNARKKLCEYGFIRCKAGQGNRYTYTICNPKTGLPYPGDTRTPIVLPRRDRAKAVEGAGVAVTKAPAERKPAHVARISSDEQKPLESYGVPGVF